MPTNPSPTVAVEFIDTTDWAEWLELIFGP
jgi:hypothetical protein